MTRKIIKVTLWYTTNNVCFAALYCIPHTSSCGAVLWTSWVSIIGTPPEDEEVVEVGIFIQLSAFSCASFLFGRGWWFSEPDNKQKTFLSTSNHHLPIEYY